MTLSKVDSLNYDKKDCQLITCPECHMSHFSVFEVVQKDADHRSHVHMRCVFCDLTWCGGHENPNREAASVGSTDASPPGRNTAA